MKRSTVLFFAVFSACASLFLAGCPLDTEVRREPGVFYLDPAGCMEQGDGSRERPWGSAQEFFATDLVRHHSYASYPWTPANQLVLINPNGPVRPGDRLVLLDGDHGEIRIQEHHFHVPLIIEAENRHKAQVSRVDLRSSSGIIIRGLTVSFDLESAERYTLVRVDGHGWRGPAYDITIQDSYIYSIENSLDWKKNDWNTLACNGVSAGGDRIHILDNEILNVNFGISYTGNHGIVRGNTIRNFAGDGMRGIGNDLLFEYNWVMDNYNVNDNHDDGFQSWSLADRGQPPRERVILRGNVIINTTDPDRPFQGGLQGIGCFDGFFIDWLVENNLIIVQHWHGITFSGAIGVRIINNTVVSLSPERPGPPWIRISAHKDGRPSADCLIQNNIAHSFSMNAAYGESTHNLRITHKMLEEVFVDPFNGDFQLRAGSPAIDVGRLVNRALTDIEGTPRPRGSGVDIGAYESF